MGSIMLLNYWLWCQKIRYVQRVDIVSSLALIKQDSSVEF